MKCEVRQWKQSKNPRTTKVCNISSLMPSKDNEQYNTDLYFYSP